ncbi:OFA family MFS transporter [Planctomycetales bacterium ZRK34]|nr:OFA family MFS transporter [Planctomycetales bacterium ZRK34]
MNLDNVKNLGWRVTMAGVGINLALGVIYAWSVVKKAIPASWEWSDFQKNLPYSIACLVFALTMIPAGRAQDRLGPRWVALAGGVAVGVGMILASLTSNVTMFVLGFGVLTGAGIGMGYAAATPAAVKWFGPHRTGLIAGLVVAGFGLASVYIAPLVKYMVGAFSVTDASGAVDTGPGVQMVLMILGVAFLVVVGGLSQLLAVPPAGWKPEGAPVATGKKPVVYESTDRTWQQMLGTPQFYLLWLMYAFAAGAGLMIIANLAPIIKLQAGAEAGNYGFLFVALLAIGNAGGRVCAGVVSDKIGRRATMLVFFLFQAGLMFVLPMVNSIAVFAIISMLLGANYGANLTLFPSVTKDYFGLKNFGVNYGWVFTAWGVGGLVLAQLSGLIYDSTRAAHKASLIADGMAETAATAQAVGNYNMAYTLAGVFLVVAALLLSLLRHPAKASEPAGLAAAAPSA